MLTEKRDAAGGGKLGPFFMAMVMSAALAACGGGGGGDGESDEGLSPPASEPIPVTHEQPTLELTAGNSQHAAAHAYVALKALGEWVPHFVFLISEVTPQQPTQRIACGGGWFDVTLTDKDRDGKVSAGDTIVTESPSCESLPFGKGTMDVTILSARDGEPTAARILIKDAVYNHLRSYGDLRPVLNGTVTLRDFRTDSVLLQSEGTVTLQTEGTQQLGLTNIALAGAQGAWGFEVAGAMDVSFATRLIDNRRAQFDIENLVSINNAQNGSPFPGAIRLTGTGAAKIRARGPDRINFVVDSDLNGDGAYEQNVTMEADQFFQAW